jgi:hypothetical protein
MQFLFLLNSEEIKILNSVSLQWIVNQDIILMALHVLLVVTVHTSQSMPSLVVNHVMVAKIQLTLLQNQRMIAKVS